MINSSPLLLNTEKTQTCTQYFMLQPYSLPGTTRVVQVKLRFMVQPAQRFSDNRTMPVWLNRTNWQIPASLQSHRATLDIGLLKDFRLWLDSEICAKYIYNVYFFQKVWCRCLNQSEKLMFPGMTIIRDE